jgi:hypothetical protein
MTWRVEKAPATRFETVAFLRDQVQRMLHLAREAKDAIVSNELLALAAWMHEKAKALEDRAPLALDEDGEAVARRET